MTKEEAYDLACTKMPEPAVLMVGDRYVIGEWIALAELPEGASPLILACKERGVRIMGEGQSWDEAVVNARLVPVGGDATLMLAEANARPSVITHTRMATLKDLRICGTYGCEEPRAEGVPFCPRCFEEHRDNREVPPPPPPSIDPEVKPGAPS